MLVSTVVVGTHPTFRCGDLSVLTHSGICPTAITSNQHSGVMIFLQWAFKHSGLGSPPLLSGCCKSQDPNSFNLWNASAALKPLPRNSCGIIITLHHLQTAWIYHLQRRMKHYVTNSPLKIKGTVINPTGRLFALLCSKTLRGCFQIVYKLWFYSQRIRMVVTKYPFAFSIISLKWFSVNA